MHDLVGSYGASNSLDNWVNSSSIEHCILHGSYGCGKTSLKENFIEKNKNSYNFVEFNSNEKLTKKVFMEKLKVHLDNKNVLNSLLFEEKKLVVIFDEVDGILDCENFSFNENSKYLIEKNIKCLFIVASKHFSKLREIAEQSKLIKLGPFNKKEIVRHVLSATNCEDIDVININIDIYKDDIRSIIQNSLYNFKKENKVEIIQDNEILSKFKIIKKNKMDESLNIIESDAMNFLFSLHENYSTLTDCSKMHQKCLYNLHLVDRFYNNMFENQSWYLAKYSHIMLYSSIIDFDYTNVKGLKIGTLWSKYSNWQYKRKLFHNFSITRSNILFKNHDYIYYLKHLILKMLVDDPGENFNKCIKMLKNMNINKDDFEQLLKITPIDIQKHNFKGSFKTKFLKELKQ